MAVRRTLLWAAGAVWPLTLMVSALAADNLSLAPGLSFTDDSSDSFPIRGDHLTDAEVVDQGTTHLQAEEPERADTVRLLVEVVLSFLHRTQPSRLRVSALRGTVAWCMLLFCPPFRGRSADHVALGRANQIRAHRGLARRQLSRIRCATSGAPCAAASPRARRRRFARSPPGSLPISASGGRHVIRRAAPRPPLPGRTRRARQARGK